MINEKGIIEEYDLVIYPFYFVVAIGDVEKEINARYKPHDDTFNWIARPPKDSAACTYNIKFKRNGSFAILIWYDSVKDFSSANLTHECDHAALEIFNLVGAKIQFDNQEPYCYLAGTLSKFTSRTYFHYREYLDSKNNSRKNKNVKKNNGKATKSKG